MALFVYLLALVSLKVFIVDAKAKRCWFQQETDPGRDGYGYRWVIPEPDPCLCTEMLVGGLTTRAAHRPFNVKYYDSFFTSSDPEEIQRFLDCPDDCASNPCLAGGTCHPQFPGYVCQYEETCRTLSLGGWAYAFINPVCNDGLIDVWCSGHYCEAGWMWLFDIYYDSETSCWSENNWIGGHISCPSPNNTISGFAVTDSYYICPRGYEWWLEVGESFCRELTIDPDLAARLSNCQPVTAENKGLLVGGYCNASASWGHGTFEVCGGPGEEVRVEISVAAEGALPELGVYVLSCRQAHGGSDLVQVAKWNNTRSRPTFRSIWVRN